MLDHVAGAGSYAHTSDGSMTVFETGVLLGFEARVGGPGGRFLIGFIGRGTGYSFGWSPLRVSGDVIERARLTEISVTPEPACTDTAVWCADTDPAVMTHHLRALRALWHRERAVAPAAPVVAAAASREDARERAARTRWMDWRSVGAPAG